nr:hypothetical protein [uncultured bacterium]
MQEVNLLLTEMRNGRPNAPPVPLSWCCGTLRGLGRRSLRSDLHRLFACHFFDRNVETELRIELEANDIAVDQAFDSLVAVDDVFGDGCVNGAIARSPDEPLVDVNAGKQRVLDFDVLLTIERDELEENAHRAFRNRAGAQHLRFHAQGGQVGVVVAEAGHCVESHNLERADFSSAATERQGGAGLCCLFHPFSSLDDWFRRTLYP